MTTLLDISQATLLNIGFAGIDGYERWSLWGNNPDVDTGSLPEVVSPLGGSSPPFMSGLTSLEIVSDSASDAAADVGARTITFEVLDSNYDRQFPVITLNGLTPVAFPSQVVAINSATVSSVGSNGSNVGVLTIRDAGAGMTRLLVPIGKNISQAAIRTVPAGYVLQIRTHIASINRTATAGRFITYTGAFQQFMSGSYGPVILPLDIAVSDTVPVFFQAEPGLIIREKGRYWHVVQDVSANNTNFTTASWGVLRKGA